MSKQQGAQQGAFRNLAVDLGSKHAGPALEVLLKMEKRRYKVRSARVFSTSGYIYSKKGVSSGTTIAEVFDLLSRLPNLKYLTVDFHHALPLHALCFLSQCPRLKELVLENVQLSGDCESQTKAETSPASGEEDVTFLVNNVLANSPALQELSLINCKGAPALETLFKSGLPNTLKKLTIGNTPIGTGMETIGLAMAQLGSNPNLLSLKLHDVPNLQDIHIQTLTATALASNNSNLTELEFTSNLLGAAAGQAIVQSLHDNCKLEHLKLHMDWEDCGAPVAEMLQTNTHLKQLDLRLYGDDDKVREDAILIAQALQQQDSSALRRLRLCMEMEPCEEDQAIVDAFDIALQSNLQLKYLELDDSIEDFPLPLTLRSKLKLNRSGAPKLWKRGHAATHEHFVQAITNQRDDLNTIFHILREEPTLICEALAGNSTEQSPTTSGTYSSEECSSDEDYPVKPNDLSPRSAVVSPKPSSKRPRKRRFFTRKVRSMFATSA